MAHDMTPHVPSKRPLIWSDSVLDIQDALLDMTLNAPLYVVGGAVRDAFLHRPIKDLDLATSGNAIRMARKIADRLDCDVFVLDDERDVARVLVGTDDEQLTIDIAHFRGDDLLADLLGRDFTVNAMAVDFFGDLSQLIDPLSGEIDLEKKVMRRCTPESLADDPLRCLRAIRQSVQFRYRIEPETVADIRNNVPRVIESSPERVRDEFFILLNLQKAASACRVAYALKMLQVILPHTDTLNRLELPQPHIFDGWKHTLETVENMTNILTAISYKRTDNTAANFDMGMLAIQLDRYRPQLNEHLGAEWANGRSHFALMMLASLVHTTDYVGGSSIKLAETVVEDLRLSNSEKKRLSGMLDFYHEAHNLDHTDTLALHRFWFTLGDMGIDAILLGLADYLATVGNELKQDDWLIIVERAVILFDTYYNKFDTVVSPPLYVNGNDLIQELSLDGGRIIGDLLTHIREAQVFGQVTNRDDALATARQYLQDNT